MRLLLAEDERELSDALTAILKHNNYSVDAVYNGADALDYALLQEYDGMILDVMMPKMDGLTVLHALREARNPVPVLLLTARSDIEDRIAGLDAGADDYLVKPFAMGELLARIRAITRRRQAPLPDLLRFGDIVLDRRRYALLGPEGSTQLGNKEYQLMEMLMERPACVLPADRLFERVWGYNTESETSVVWVYLSGLRKKLLRIGSCVEIRAMRNVGYILEERQ